MDHPTPKVFIVLNPTAGKEVQATEVRSALARYFPPPQWRTEIYETTGKEDLPSLVRTACKQGARLVVAAGGDGTLVDVANGLVNGNVPLGILPLGTGNDLARSLGVPLTIDGALQLLAGDHDVVEIDALKVRDRFSFSNVSVGISPLMMNETSSEAKKRFGLPAYFWTLIKRPSILRMRAYVVTIDGRLRRIRASEILLSNSTLLVESPNFFGPLDTLQDGQMDAYFVTADAGSRLSAASLGRSPPRPGQTASKLRHVAGMTGKGTNCRRSLSRLVQADGEVIGHTPVEIELIPRVIKVIAPKPTPTGVTRD